MMAKIKIAVFLLDRGVFVGLVMIQMHTEFGKFMCMYESGVPAVPWPHTHPMTLNYRSLHQMGRIFPVWLVFEFGLGL